MDGNFDESWMRIASPMLLVVLQAQADAAERAVGFVPDTLGALNVDADPDGEVVPDSLVGVAGDGRPVDTLLLGAKVAAKQAVAAGGSQSAALAAGGKWLNLAVKTLLSDTGRAAESLGVAARPGVGYVRMLNPPSCSRCVVLAGKFYRYKAGFRRHPGCDCRHIPSRESIAGDLTVDPNRYFKTLSKEAQDSTFGSAGAQAIRDGADVNQVVNANRGTTTAQVYGQRLAITTEGITRRGVAYNAMSRAGYAQRATDVRNGRYFQAKSPRLMPETIYRLAEDRADALRLLRLYGYLQ
jgi:hypothetical protein